MPVITLSVLERCIGIRLSLIHIIPERKDLVIPVFKSAENGKDVNSGELKNKIMEFLGTEVTERGFVHFNFDCEGKLYYHEVKNITLEQYCMKPKACLLYTSRCV